MDPTSKGFWQRVARLVPGSKTASDCHDMYMSQFGSTPAEKPKKTSKAPLQTGKIPKNMLGRLCVKFCTIIATALNKHGPKMVPP